MKETTTAYAFYPVNLFPNSRCWYHPFSILFFFFYFYPAPHFLPVVPFCLSLITSSNVLKPLQFQCKTSTYSTSSYSFHRLNFSYAVHHIPWKTITKHDFADYAHYCTILANCIFQYDLKFRYVVVPSTAAITVVQFPDNKTAT